MAVDGYRLLFTLSIILRQATPVALAVLGESVSELAGVVNLGLEGVMLVGALVGAYTGITLGSNELGLLAGGVAGMFFALFLALLVNGLKLNQFIAGIAVYVTGYALTTLLGAPLSGVPAPYPRFIGPFELSTIVLLALPLVMWYVMRRYGVLRVLRAVGDNPYAADIMGIDVTLVRTLALAFNGFVAGIAGAYVSLVVFTNWREGITAGLGWLSLALTPMTGWSPVAAYLPGLVYAVAWISKDLVFAGLPDELRPAAPYVLSLVAAAAAAKLTRSRAPRGLGREYVHGVRG